MILAGDKDPSSNMGKGVEVLIKRYEKYGIKNITKKIYEGARHEVFNETNRNEVIQDLIEWLDEHI